MDVKSVSSNVAAFTNVATQPSQAQQSQQTQSAQEARPVQPRPEERVERQEEAPKPVVNALGQTTGTLISVTA